MHATAKGTTKDQEYNVAQAQALRQKAQDVLEQISAGKKSVGYLQRRNSQVQLVRKCSHLLEGFEHDASPWTCWLKYGCYHLHQAIRKCKDYMPTTGAPDSKVQPASKSMIQVQK